jgi:hypothetical protein
MSATRKMSSQVGEVADDLASGTEERRMSVPPGDVAEDLVVTEEAEVEDHLVQVRPGPGVLLADRVAEGSFTEDPDSLERRGAVLVLLERDVSARLHGEIGDVGVLLQR